MAGAKSVKVTSLENVLEMVDEGQSILFTVSQRFNSHLNLLLLRHMVKDRGLKGVYLTVDRPSDIMKKLLQAKRIDPEKVIFLDPVSRVSGLPSPPIDRHVRFMDNPFFGDIMYNFSEEGLRAFREAGVNFVMIDNMAALSCYVDNDTIKAMLLSMGKWKDLTVLMCTDDMNPKVEATVKGICSKAVSFNEHMVPLATP